MNLKFFSKVVEYISLFKYSKSRTNSFANSLVITNWFLLVLYGVKSKWSIKIVNEELKCMENNSVNVSLVLVLIHWSSNFSFNKSKHTYISNSCIFLFLSFKIEYSFFIFFNWFNISSVVLLLLLYFNNVKFVHIKY